MQWFQNCCQKKGGSGLLCIQSPWQTKFVVLALVLIAIPLGLFLKGLLFQDGRQRDWTHCFVTELDVQPVDSTLKAEQVVVDFFVASKRILDGTLELIEKLWIDKARELGIQVVYHTDMPLKQLLEEARLQTGPGVKWIQERFPYGDPPGVPLKPGHEVQKGIVLSILHTMMTLFPGRKYYLSVEDDTVLNPERLLRLLRTDPQLSDPSVPWIAGYGSKRMIWGGMAIFSQRVAEAFVDKWWLLSCMLHYDTLKLFNGRNWDQVAVRNGAVANDDHYWSWCALQVSTKSHRVSQDGRLLPKLCHAINVMETVPHWLWASGKPISVHNVKGNRKRKEAASLLGLTTSREIESAVES